MTGKHAAGTKTSECHHLFHRLSVDAAKHKIGLQSFANLAFASAGGFVKSQRQIKLFQSTPERLVIVVVPLMVNERVSSQKNRAETQFLRAPTCFVDCVAHVVR